MNLRQSEDNSPAKKLPTPSEDKTPSRIRSSADSVKDHRAAKIGSLDGHRKNTFDGLSLNPGKLKTSSNI